MPHKKSRVKVVAGWSGYSGYSGISGWSGLVRVDNQEIPKATAIKPFEPIYFDAGQAKVLGLREAIILHFIVNSLRLNRDKPDNQRDGRTWVWHSTRAFCEHYPFWSAKIINGTLKSLLSKAEGRGPVLVKAHYPINGNHWNRTLWWSLSDEFMFLMNRNYERKV